ncbi:MAG: hypothetical protein ACKOBY_07910 [Cyanobium sp.]
MYLLTIRDGLHTRHVGPYPSTTAAAAEQIEAILAGCGEHAYWQIHELEAPLDQPSLTGCPERIGCSPDHRSPDQGVAA